MSEGYTYVWHVRRLYIFETHVLCQSAGLPSYGAAVVSQAAQHLLLLLLARHLPSLAVAASSVKLEWTGLTLFLQLMIRVTCNTVHTFQAIAEC